MLAMLQCKVYRGRGNISSKQGDAMKESIWVKSAIMLDNLVRHRAILGRHMWLRNLLRRPYHRLINFHGLGIPVRIGGLIETRLPPEFSSKLMEHYEVPAISALHDWLENKQEPLVVDVGCSIGYISCACLFCNHSATVISVDSDLNSLQSLMRMCTYCPQNGRDNRLFPIYGFVADKETDPLDYRTLSRQLRARLAGSDISGDPGTHKFININENTNDDNIPIYSLDGLLRNELLTKQDILVKIDVEGAELLVLHGAKSLLRTGKVIWSVSVHPEYIKKYGATANDLHDVMKEMGYSGRLLSTDHEEHWWYQPR